MLVPLEVVVLKVMEMLPKDAISEEKIEEWAYESLESICSHEVYDTNVCYERVHNHKARIPKGTFTINMILYEANIHRDNHQTNLDDGTMPIKTLSNEPDYIPIDSPLNIYINQHHRDRWRPLSVCTNVFSKNILHPNSPNLLCHNCKDCFNIDARTGCIITSFDSGRLAISYSSIPKDDNDKWLMPDNQDIIKAVETYCLKRYFQFRMNMNDDGADSRYRLYSQEYELLAPKATGIMMMPDYMDYQNLRNINKFIKEDSPFSVALGALTNSEKLHFGNQRDRYMYNSPFNMHAR
jgi:hypothetical protein